VVEVLRRVSLQVQSLAQGRHPADPHRASAKTRVSDPAAAEIGQVGLGCEHFDGAGVVATTRRVRAITSPSKPKVMKQTSAHRSGTSTWSVVIP